ncbi:hypothetical protein [Saliterribacillus persicus]|uniref:Uncharacterized protein n=1 Tax=Saliterribacillus persicus TaxID=930114 RepID=A0A368X623_9BACI|nr:hypothetical protein [Saliterribacillus persicus]RCW63393.1 hypothetical protein DFR57_11860 [Saliterribacillus persicus]
MSFKTSVNIKFDVGNEEFINRYIPTPSHIDALKGILKGFNNDSNRTHIVIGAYGTGKSLIATVLSYIVSEKNSSNVVDRLINKFMYFDDYIAEQIKSASSSKKRYIPVLLNGNEGNFREALLSSIIKNLNNNGIDIVLPGISERVMESIETWKESFPSTYNKFIKKLEEQGKEIQKWEEEIKKYNEAEFEFFRNIYPELTSGAVFNVGHADNFNEQLEYLNERLDELNIGIFVVYDEFGRFLQGLTKDQLSQTMQDIQDTAEIISRSESMQLLLITHKSLRQYFKGSQDEVAKEFQRIEKRFSQYYITSDQNTFLRVAEAILAEVIQNKPNIDNRVYSETLNNLKRYNLFPSLNPSEEGEKIVKTMYPLHPITLFLLPNLSGVFGQNERTLFTLLESEETGGLKNHMSSTNDYYMPSKLFDYFFRDISDSEDNSAVKNHLILYKKAIARIPDYVNDRKLITNIIKLISLWNLCGLQSEQKLNTDFLSFGIECGKEELNALLRLLSEHKIIRFNGINKYWELHSGSAMDIEKRINERKKSLNITQEEISSVLKGNLPKKYFFPEEYNDTKEMTRFAKVEIVFSDELDKLNFKAIDNSDITILFIIPKDDGELHSIKKDLRKLGKNEKILCAIHTESLNSILENVKESFIINDLLNDKTLLAEDKGVQEELRILLSEKLHEIINYLSSIVAFNDEVVWLKDLREVKIKNNIELSNLLSQKSFELYKHTPVILNDSFNRVNLSSAQRKAGIKLINHIIDSYPIQQFGITGNGPDYAIYASIFKRNGELFKNVNSLDFDSIEYKPYKLIRKEILSELENNPKGNFGELIKIFTEKPFGIRKPVIPILLVSLLRDRWNEFMLYRNEMYIAGLNGDALYEILYEEGPENYQYVYENLDEKYLDYFNFIEENFTEYNEDRLEGKSRLIKICGTLIKWLRSLPRYTQISNFVDPDFSRMRALIRKTEVKPQDSIDQLYEEFGKEKLNHFKEYAANYLGTFKQELITAIFQTCKVNNIKELKDWANNAHDFLKKNNKLINATLDLSTENWLSQFVEIYIGVQISNWSDTTYDLFISQLKNDYEEVVNFSEYNEENSTSQFITIDISGERKIISRVDLSVKTTTIYKNVDRMIKNAGRNVPKKELEYMVYSLLEKYVE